ncbi:MAG: NUDIX domain-containing protein [Rhizobiaceae bacterium]|nr:NUDIX domain-containing protein [Rhizobiaceae bacterium]
MADHWVARKLFHWWFLLKRPMTLGVRVAIENSNGEFLLVRHTYVSGWYFPGGGVERGETFVDAAIKEVREETGINIRGSLSLFGLYFNQNASPRDHVALFHLHEDPDISGFTPNREIAEIGFFQEHSLPEDTTRATRRRIEELRRRTEQVDHW